MADLHRPAARKDAAAALEARIVDPVVRGWVTERIAKDEINRLSIWVQSGRTEETVLAAWQNEAALAEETAPGRGSDAMPDHADMLRVAKLLESLAGTETITSDGPKRPGNI